MNKKYKTPKINDDSYTFEFDGIKFNFCFKSSKGRWYHWSKDECYWRMSVSEPDKLSLKIKNLIARRIGIDYNDIKFVY